MTAEAPVKEQVKPTEEKPKSSQEKKPVSQRAKDMLITLRAKLRGNNLNPDDALAAIAETPTTEPLTTNAEAPSNPLNSEVVEYRDPSVVYQEAIEKLPPELTPNQAFERLKEVADSQKPKPETPTRHFSVVDKARHKALALEARARGVTDIDGFQKMVIYLESSVEIQNMNKPNQSFNVGREHIPIITKLMSLHKDPLTMIQTLREAGLSFTDHAFNPRYQTSPLHKTNMEYVSEFAALPNVDAALAVLRGIKSEHPALTISEGGSSRLDAFMNIMRDPTLSSQFTPEAVSRISTLINALDMKSPFHIGVHPSQLPEYLSLIKNPNQFNTLVTMLATGNGGIKSGVFEKLQGMQDAGILEQVRVLCANGVNLDGKIYESREKPPGSSEEYVVKIQGLLADPAIHAFATDEGKRRFVKLVAQNGGKHSISVEDITKDLKHFDQREQYAYIRRLLYGNSASPTERDLAWDIAESPYLRNTYSKPEFNDFLNSLKEQGYEPGSLDFYKYTHIVASEFPHRITGNLANIFVNRNTYAEIYTDPTAAMVKAVSNEDTAGFVSHLKDYPSLVDTVKVLKQYGGVTDETLPDLNSLIDFTNNNITNNPLLKKDLMGSIPEDKRAQWFQGAVFIPDYARRVIEKRLGEQNGFSQTTLDQLISVHTAIKALSSGDLSGFDESVQKTLTSWDGFPEKLKEFTLERFPGFPFLSTEESAKLERAARISESIDQSPSREMQRLKEDLLLQLWGMDDPTPALNQIRQVFEQNNLPISGKIFRVFEIIQSGKDINGKTNFEARLEENANTSEVLRNASATERFSIVYKDLLRMHIDSDNPSFRHYLEVLRDGDALVARIDSGISVDSLTPDEQSQLAYFLNKMDTLYANSVLGRRAELKGKAIGTQNISSVNERIAALKKSFHLREGQGFSDRVTELFVKPLGLRSLEEVVERMKGVKPRVDARNRKEANKVIAEFGGIITVKPGDLLKGTSEHYLTSQLENGFGCPEVLGADSSSDRTPFDTDVSRIMEGDVTQNGIKYAIEKSLVRAYGDIILLIRNRGQFDGETGYDLFKTGVTGDQHYGIRTGFASTEVDAIMMQEYFDKRNTDKLFLEIAQNGFYIPVADTEGKIIFTPEMYDQYRKTFDGISEYDGKNIEVRRANAQDKEYAQVQELVRQIAEEEPKVNLLSQNIRNVVQEVLSANNVRLRDAYDTGLYGGDLLDTGSTGRHTNTPGEHDFDMMLLLDARDMARASEIAEAIKSRLGGTPNEEHGDEKYIQIRRKGATGVSSEEALDIDLGIAKRTDYAVFASHDAIATKLSSISDQYGTEVAREVVANIILAKRILKEGHAYKKQEDGGFGGIGVENWILENKGSLREAFETFYAAAVRNGQKVPFAEFQRNYKIFDAGANLRFIGENKHDNYTGILKETGYNAMVETIGRYLNAS